MASRLAVLEIPVRGRPPPWTNQTSIRDNRAISHHGNSLGRLRQQPRDGWVEREALAGAGAGAHWLGACVRLQAGAGGCRQWAGGQPKAGTTHASAPPSQPMAARSHRLRGATAATEERIPAPIAPAHKVALPLWPRHPPHPSS